MLNMINLQGCLYSRPLNQSITSYVLFRCLKCSELRSFILILSKMVLLILASSFFAGFKNLTLGLLRKLGLWYFNNLKQFCLQLTNILFITSLFFSMFFSLAVYLILCFLANLFVICRDNLAYQLFVLFHGTLRTSEVLSANVKVVLVFFYNFYIIH